MSGFVLIMVLFHGDPVVLQQEFTSYASCEKARAFLEKDLMKSGVSIESQGCFSKS